MRADGRIASFGGELQDFADTAALVAELDLVISVDTSVAHLTGSLGVPVWILLPRDPDCGAVGCAASGQRASSESRIPNPESPIPNPG